MLKRDVEEDHRRTIEQLFTMKATGHPAVRSFLGRYKIGTGGALSTHTMRMVAEGMNEVLKFLPNDGGISAEVRVAELEDALRRIVGDTEQEYAILGTEVPAEVQCMIDIAKRALEGGKA